MQVFFAGSSQVLFSKRGMQGYLGTTNSDVITSVWQCFHLVNVELHVPLDRLCHIPGTNQWDVLAPVFWVNRSSVSLRKGMCESWFLTQKWDLYCSSMFSGMSHGRHIWEPPINVSNMQHIGKHISRKLLQEHKKLHSSPPTLRYLERGDSIHFPWGNTTIQCVFKMQYCKFTQWRWRQLLKE